MQPPSNHEDLSESSENDNNNHNNNNNNNNNNTMLSHVQRHHHNKSTTASSSGDSAESCYRGSTTVNRRSSMSRNDSEDCISFFSDSGDAFLDDDDDDENNDNADGSTKSPLETTFANKSVSVLRIMVTISLVVTGVFFSVGTYLVISEQLDSEFEQMFENEAFRVLSSIQTNLDNKLFSMDLLSTNITNYVQYSKLAWPLVYIPDYEDQVSRIRQMSHVHSIGLLPLVTHSRRVAWETYSVAVFPIWYQNSLQSLGINDESIIAEENNTMTTTTTITSAIPANIHNEETIAPQSEHYFPSWQYSPANETSLSSYNSDALYNTQYATLLTELLITKEAVMSEMSFHQKHKHQDQHYDEAESKIFYPIFDNDGLNVAAVLVSTNKWSTFLRKVSSLSSSSSLSYTTTISDAPVIVVVEDSQQHISSYRVMMVNNEDGDDDDEEEIAYLGNGDFHDTKYDSMVIESSSLMDDISLYESSRGIPLNHESGTTTYTFRVYPTQEMQDEFNNTNNNAAAAAAAAILYTVMVVVAFVVLILLFLIYDCLVQRRQDRVLKQAIQSTAIVSSLFPKHVHDSLLQSAMEDTYMEEREKSLHRSNNTTFTEDDRNSESEENRNQRSSGGGGSDKNVVAEPSKMRLRSFLETSNDSTPGVLQAKPIADFFPNCTVMFEDIVGFTAWSSSREPTQVFLLLQSIYHEFDKTAKKRGVFKVETIGDSYVAVTGLPEPQDDHAVIMAGFALECRKLMRDVTRNLEKSLGPETGDLCMRIGLHSGPVTAGVLRGEKSRFQLFGDTVNTASRMESTGTPNRIQLSGATAALLKEAGKDDWLVRREDAVFVKGKGEMNTFWFEAQRSKRKRRMSIATAFKSFTHSARDLMVLDRKDSSDDDKDDGGGKVPERQLLRHQPKMIWGNSDMSASTTSLASLDTATTDLTSKNAADATSRLIEWNVEVLQGLLKQVVARRVTLKKALSLKDLPSQHLVSKEDQIVFLAENINNGTSVFDEVKEIITLPTFDENLVGEPIDSDSVELDPDVVKQLQEYVQVIAGTYRDNPFHNYEHACHVQMSMMKFLQRVVTPEIDYSGEKTEMASDAHNYTFGIASDPLTQFALLFSALIHDADHTGVSNGQLVKENAHIATLYQGKCVAEQNSIDLAWNLLMDSNYEALRECIYTNDCEFQRFRQLVVNIVLATDIFDKELGELRKNRWAKAFSAEKHDDDPLDDANRKATIVIEHLIQASDVSHTMQHWDIYRKWNERLFYELQLSYKSGRTDTDPADGWYKGELWFFDNYIIPLTKKLKECSVFGVSSEECLKYAEENRALWEAQGEQIVKEMSTTDYFAKYKGGKCTKRTRRFRRKGNLSLSES